MTHPIIDDVTRRYTTKKYDATKRISAENMAVIKEALRLSPSSVNSQPWKFIIIESEGAKQRFHDTFAHKFEMNQKHAKEASHIIPPGSHIIIPPGQQEAPLNRNPKRETGPKEAPNAPTPQQPHERHGPRSLSRTPEGAQKRRLPGRAAARDGAAPAEEGDCRAAGGQ